MGSGDVLNAAVAVGTTLLAVATFLLVWETRAARLEAARERRGAAFRAALVEALDNCRWWEPEDPAKGPRRVAAALSHPPVLLAVQGLLATVDLPAPFLARLLWLVGSIPQRVETVRTTAIEGYIHTSDRPLPVDGHGQFINPTAEAVNRVRDHWLIVVDLLQSVADLVRCEAQRQGFGGLASTFSGHRWLVPKIMAQGRVSDEVARTIYLDAPQFPTDPAYAECSPGAREAAATEANAKVMASLSGIYSSPL